ncbi:neutral zinc metallopeptidase [Sphaerisporangium aureirubrum]|uniref:Neutral zinc metallopeptidase n=1 Tax=Sphaerisporangium aureirubrum TaxID=1544736 RepID=A0ABW1NIQ5_9ACTN
MPRRSAPGRGGPAGNPWRSPVAVLGFLAVVVTVILVGGALASPEDSPAPALSSVPQATGTVDRSSLERNPIYRARPLTATCRAPEADDTETRLALLNTMADCMDAAWHPAFTARALSFQLPTRIFWTEPGRGPCGDYPGDAAAYYCWANHGIYLGAADDEHRMVLTAILAHEYGHHVQEISGLSDAAVDRMYHATSKDAVNAVSRRVELQADCFAGVWFGAARRSLPVTPDDWRLILDDFARRGDDDDDRTHGTGEHGAAWLNGGYLGRTPGHCVTWAAPAADVD